MNLSEVPDTVWESRCQDGAWELDHHCLVGSEDCVTYNRWNGANFDLR